MKDSWWNHNTDKVLLLFLVVMFWVTTIKIALYIFFHLTDSMVAVAFISFMTGSVTTVLGAFVMMLTGRANRADGQTGNGRPPSPAPTALAINQVPPEPPKS